jgi:hypothetical protein
VGKNAAKPSTVSVASLRAVRAMQAWARTLGYDASAEIPQTPQACLHTAHPIAVSLLASSAPV